MALEDDDEPPPQWRTAPWACERRARGGAEGCRMRTGADRWPHSVSTHSRIRPNNTFGFLVPEATFCREDAQNPVSGTRFCHLSRDRHTPEPPRYRAFCGFLGPDTCISGSFTAPSCLSARSCPVPDGGGCSRRVWVGPWSLWQVQKCYSVSARWPVCIIVAICWAPGSTDGHDCASCV